MLYMEGSMGQITAIGKFFDRKLRIIVEIQKHSHGYYYLYFGEIRTPYEPDIILAARFINFEGRFSKDIPNPCGEVCDIGIKCLEKNNFFKCEKRTNIIFF